MPQRRRVPVTRQNARPAPASAIHEEEDDRGPGCDCPRLDPEEWQDVESDWSDIAFVRGGLWALAGVPFGYASIRAKLTRKVEAAGGSVPADPMLLLGFGRLRRKVLLEGDDLPSSGRGIYRPGGVAFTRVVSAPPGRVKGAVKEVRERVTRRYQREPDAIWLWFLTCRVCSSDRDFETLVVAHFRNVPGAV